MTRPSASGILLGYQRRTVISATRVHVRVNGSKILVSRVPISPPPWPPITIRRPSLNSAWPAQNTSPGAVTVVTVFVCGSQRRASDCGPSYPSHTSTSRVGSSEACTATTGQSIAGAHVPSSAAGSVGGGSGGGGGGGGSGGGGATPPTGVFMSALICAAVSG